MRTPRRHHRLRPPRRAGALVVVPTVSSDVHNDDDDNHDDHDHDHDDAELHPDDGDTRLHLYVCVYVFWQLSCDTYDADHHDAHSVTRPRALRRRVRPDPRPGGRRGEQAPADGHEELFAAAVEEEQQGGGRGAQGCPAELQIQKTSTRSQSRSPPPVAPVLPSCLRSPSIASASPTSPSSPSDPEPARSFSALGATAPTSTSGDTPTSTSTSDAPPSTSTLSLPPIDTSSSASLSADPSASAHPSAPPPSPRTPLRLPTPPPPPPLAALLTVYTTPIQSTSATVSAPLSAAPANAASRERTVPLRACCAECAAGAKMEVREEAFSRGALRVRRRAALLGGGVGGADTLFEAARRGGFLDIPAADGAHQHQQLLSGTGLAEVTRLVAELELRRSRSATPSPGGTPPVSPGEYAPGHAHGRASPSLLGPALARLADGGEGGAYGERLAPGDAAHGSRSGSGRASPLLPLGIAVDEVDKERRRRSEDFGALGGGHGHGHSAIGIAMAGAAALNLAGEDEFDGEQAQTMHGKPPSPQILYEHVSAASGFPFAASSSSGQPSSAPAGSTSFPSTAGSAAPKRRTFNAPVRGYADDDDAELFPLPSASGSRGGTPRESPRGSPAASASDVNVTLSSAKRLSRGSPKAGALLSAALTGAAREREAGAVLGGNGNGDGNGKEKARDAGAGAGENREDSTPPPSSKERERSRSEAVCLALGSMGRREREALERSAKCSRGLLLPPGDERECSDSSSTHSNNSNSNSNSHSNAGSREGSMEGGSGESAVAGAGAAVRTGEKPLPVLPHLATSVLAAGLYSPAIASRGHPREANASSESSSTIGSGSMEGKSNHLRVASAPAGVSLASASVSEEAASSTTPTPLATPATPISASTATPTPTTGRSTRAVSTPSAAPVKGNRAKSASTASATAPALGQLLRRDSSSKRLRSPSTSSGKSGGGRKAFGALVDVLKGVTSMSGTSAGTVAI